MSGLRLGDYILDSRGFVCIPSLKVVVCSGLQTSMTVGIGRGVRKVIEKVDSVLDDYQPEILLNLGPMANANALNGISKRWGKKVKISFIARKSNTEARHLAERLGYEVHKELIWDKYRFVENEDLGNIKDPLAQEVQLGVLNITGGKNYGVQFGNQVLGGTRLPVFIKGYGCLVLPSLNPIQPQTSIFQRGLSRFDVFAIGHKRVLPLGKVVQVKARKRMGQGLPLARSTFESDSHNKEFLQ